MSGTAAGPSLLKQQLSTHHQALIVDFNALSPIEQRKHLFDLEERAGSSFSRSNLNPLHIFKKSALDAAMRREAFIAYTEAKQAFTRHYEQIQARQVDLPLIGDYDRLASLKDFEYFRDNIWEKKFSGPEQVKFLEQMSNHVNIFSVPVFSAFLETIKKYIAYSGRGGIFAKVFIINEVAARYRLPEDLEKKVKGFLESIVENWSSQRSITLAKEGLKLLAYNHRTEPVETRSYMKTVVKCMTAARDKINNTSFTSVTFLLALCLIIFFCLI